MNKYLSFIAVCVFLISCTQVNSDTNPCPEPDYTVYEKNQQTLQKLFAGFENKEIDESILSEDFREVGTGFEEPDRNKDETIENWNMMMQIMSMDLIDATFLPGVDSTNFKIDGSVRYYGKWNMKMGESNADLMAYGSMDFNENGQITTLYHYADFTATLQSLIKKNPEVAQMMGQ